MPLVRKLKGEFPTKVNGIGHKVLFNKDGISDMSAINAKHFLAIPGYVLVAEENREEKEVKPVDDEKPDVKEEGEAFDIVTFKTLSWQKQKALVEKGKVPVEFLEVIVEAGEEDYTAVIKKTAQAVLDKVGE